MFAEIAHLPAMQSCAAAGREGRLLERKLDVAGGAGQRCKVAGRIRVHGHCQRLATDPGHELYGQKESQLGAERDGLHEAREFG